MSKYTSGKSGSLLKDSSWIRKSDDEDEDIDRDPNFGKSLLSGRTETSVSPDGKETKTTITTSRSTSVQALTKRFSTSQDELNGSSLPSSRTSSYSKSSYSTGSPTRLTTSTVFEDPKSSTRTTTVSKDGTTTETTITTTSQTLRSALKSPSKTETFTERVKSSSKAPAYSSYSPSRTSKVTETTVDDDTTNAEDKLYDSLIPSTIKDDVLPSESKRSISTTETVTVVKGSNDTDRAEDELFSTLTPSSTKDDFSSTDRSYKTTTRTSSSAEDNLYDSLLPRSITSMSDVSPPVSSSSSFTRREVITVESSRGGESPTLSSPSSIRTTSSYSSYTDDLPSTRTTSYTISSMPSEDSSKRYSYPRTDSSYEYSSITSPTYSTKSYRSSSRSDDSLIDPVYSSSVKSVYSSSERTVHEKDLCSYCRKPFTGDAKMVLDDLKINCHASCFKCEVCNSTLGHMKAGDSMWIYKRMVHCENCFDVTREKWRR